VNRPPFLKFLAFLSLASSLTYAPVVSAQGLFAGSKGARTAGRGGAVGAKADDLTAVEYNPAGLTQLGTTTIQVSNRFSYNMETFTRQPSFEDAGGGGQYVVFDKVKNQEPLQALDPLIGVGSNFGLKDFAAALTAYSPPGAARMSFPQGQQSTLSDGGQRYMMVAREAEMLIYALSLAYKYKDLFGVGGTAQWIHVPRLNYSVVVAPILFGMGGNSVRTDLDMVSSVEASDPFTFNAIIGGWLRPMPSLQFGFSAQIVPSEIKAKGTIKVETADVGTPLETTRNGEPADDVQLSIPLPNWLRFAARYLKEHEVDGKKELKYDIEFDLVFHTWSRVKSFELASDNLVARLPAGSLAVGDVDVAKAWRDTLTLQLGGDYAVLPKRLTLRAGASYETAVSYSEYSNVDFPTGQHLSGAVGASVFFGGFELALAYAYRHQLPVKTTIDDGRVYQITPGSRCEPPYSDSTLCPVPGQPAPTVNGGTYTAYNHFLNLDVMYRF